MKTLPSQASVYRYLCKLSNDLAISKESRAFRLKYLNPSPLVKTAFDTRRINQDLEFNPRRNLQYYQRSEPFIDDESADKVQLFFKVKAATDALRQQFIGEPDWLDSYTRILCNAIDQTLRVEQKDHDYSKAQLDYLSELLYVRYRLRPEDVQSYSPEQLKTAILNKDERLTRRAVFINYSNDGLNKNSVHPYVPLQPIIAAAPPIQDTLMDKLFTDVKASKDNKNVERSVTITIKDSLIDPPVVKTADENDIEKKEE